MKKSLLSLLAIALAAVGCQNYDDQFDDLNSQIAALSSQVAGLAQVQSDLASLAGTVSSLQSTVASTATAIEGLDGLAENVAAIQESVNDVASSEDVADLSADIDSAQEDLDELLAQSSVFTNNVVVNSVATLDVYHKMGSSLNVVAGNVDITAKPDMDATKLQELVNNIFTTTGEYDYQASSSSVAPVTFDNLTGTQTLTIDQAGDYSFKTLGSATVINLKDSYKSKVTKIDFRELTSVQKFQTNGADNTISFSKAVELHLTKLVYYPPLNLTVVVDEGAAMPFVMDDVDATGDQSDITLDITGPASFSVSNISDGTIDVSEVKDVTINGFEGGITIKKGVENFSADKVVTLTLTGTLDLETMDITGAKDSDVSTSVGPALDLDQISSLETVDVDGFLKTLDVTSNGNLTDLTIAADVAGKIDIDGNTDLTTITVTGAKATELDVNANTDLEALTVDLTWRAGTATGDKLDGDLTVTGNTSLESLVVSSDKLENMTVTGNDDLTSIDLNGLTAGGATGTPAINISDNDLSATLVDKDDTASSSTGDGEANDLGSISNSGIKNASAYLTAIAATTGAKVEAFYDTVDFTTEADATSEVLYVTGTANASQDTKLRLAYIVPNTADTGDTAITAKRSFVILDKADLQLTVNNSAIFTIGDLDDNNAVAIGTQILTTANLAAATAAGATLTATDGAGVVMSKIMFGLNSSSTENSQTTAVSTTFSVHVSDVLDLSLEGFSIQMSGTAFTSTMTFAEAIMASWTAKYATALANRWDLATAENSSFAVIEFTARDQGTGSLGQAMTASFDIESGTLTNMGYVIGNGESFTSSGGDNSSKGSSIVLTLEAATAGDLLSEIGNFGDAVANGSRKVSLTGGNFLELSSTYNPNISGSNATQADFNVYAYESRRNDVRVADEARVAASSNASTFSRIGWL